METWIILTTKEACCRVYHFPKQNLLDLRIRKPLMSTTACFCTNFELKNSLTFLAIIFTADEQQAVAALDPPEVEEFATERYTFFQC
jgi:hypothetical protein